MRWLRWVLLVCSSAADGAAAGDLEAALDIAGPKVKVSVRRKDGTAADGIQVRLLQNRQSTVAVARTNRAGEWNHRVTQAGAYEAVVEPDEGEPIHLAFAIVNPVADRSAFWVAGGVGLVCLAAAAGALTRVVRARRALGAVIVFSLGLVAWSGWHLATKASATPLPAGPDVAGAARAFLKKHEVAPLSAPLENVLSAATPVPTQPHPLLGKPAPDFLLGDHCGDRKTLRGCVDRGPVVLVFYYGYYCNHCVSQLFALHDDIAKFRELGAEVIAISADPPEWTRERFRQYGPFAFPVLSDPGNKVAQAYGVFRPAGEQGAEDLKHATFVIGPDGVVQWAQLGYEPFTDNAALLAELARLTGRRETQ